MPNEEKKYSEPIEDLSIIIQYLYPDAISGKGFVIQNDSDSKGAFISKWDPALGTQPSEALLKSKREEALDAKEAEEQDESQAEAALLEKLKLTIEDFDLLKKMIRGR